MRATDLALDPLLPPWAAAIVAALLLIAVVVAAWRARRIAPTRLAVALVALLVLLNPVRRIEERAARPDIAVALVDRSASMGLERRTQQVDAALKALRDAAPDVEWQVVEVPPAPGQGTRLMPTLDQALRGVPPERFAGAVVLTDGIVRDQPDPNLLPPDRPLHLLLAGDQRLRDRRLTVTRVPPYSVVGQPAAITLQVDDGPDGRAEVARLEWQVNGVPQPEQNIAVGKPVRLDVPVERRGPIEVALSVEALPDGEATLVNNRALVRLNGVRDRLRVLLISGVPYPGGRVWRDTLKADPNIDLIHFTILRLPTSYDPTPGAELALIPFPVEELFEQRLSRFDLVIFDRFGLTELLSPLYFARLADHVRDGGGMLVIAGDEFGEPGGLADTALSKVLPARPVGPVIEKSFVPALTPIGRRHPVTASLPAAWGSERWGAWGQQANVQANGGQIVMSGADGRPLLMLERVGKGRVGLLASTDVWWWAHAVEGDGPREELLRRTSHWLMQEPDLAEDRLDVSAEGRRLSITARGLEPPTEARLVDPTGATRQIALSPRPDGSGVATVDVAHDGLYRVEAGGQRRFVLAGDVAEFSEVRPRAAPLDRLTEHSRGGVFWLNDGQPALRRVDAGDDAAGGDWLGLVRNRGGELIGVHQEPLLPPALAWGLLAALMSLAWWRERH